MLSLRAAATLLERSSGLAGLTDLARALGFTAPLAPIDAALRREIGLGRGDRAAVVRGSGERRALLVVVGSASLRDAVSLVARRLAARSPQPLWCVLACERHGSGVVVAAWDGERTPPRIRALTADRLRLSDSDADTIRALHAAAREPGLLAHAEWLELLGRDALSRRFYQEASAVVEALATAIESPRVRLGSDERRELALLQLSRLLFLSFVEAKGWLAGDRSFLSHGFTRVTADGGGYDRRVLRPLFFGTLNTPPPRRAAAARAFGRVPFLNGGLFARTPLERRAKGIVYPDRALGLVFDRLLTRFRFTAREDQATWSDAAIDPEMLGRAFESLMQGEARRTSGAYYTPQALVAHVTRAGLRAALQRGSHEGGGAAPSAGLVDALLGGETVSGPGAEALRRRLRSLRVLDPACGSGAFLVHALETLADLARQLGDQRSVAEVRRELLTTAIFGVDANPTAVWLCELRLWLSVVIESDEADPLRVRPLPNLDRNVRVGDALAGGGFDAATFAGGVGGGAEPEARLRRRYVRATGSAKSALSRRLAAVERRAAIALLGRRVVVLDARRRELLAAVRGRDLFGGRQPPDRQARGALTALRVELREARARRRAVVDGGGLPFAFASHFAEVAREGGFQLVLGNPPWVRLHRISPEARRSLRRESVVVRHAAWRPDPGAEGGTRLGVAFASQVDLAAPFVERSLSLLTKQGSLALVLPGKLWRSLAGGGLRRHLMARARLLAVEDWTHSRHAFDAAVYPSVLIATAAAPTGDANGACVAIAERERTSARVWAVPQASLPMDGDPTSGAPWLLVPSDVRRAFQQLAAAGVPLARSLLGVPLLGVKCGFNAAFVLRGEDGGCSEVEEALLRPLLRGERLCPWRVGETSERILWTHDDSGQPLGELPPGARRWLLPHRRPLQRRADARLGGRWWKLFRVEAARCDRPRVVWRDVGLAPCAAVLLAGDRTVPLNSCYVLRCATDEDAFAAATLLNAPISLAWLSLVAEPARGRYFRFLAWTAGLLPVPRAWERSREPLAALGRAAWCGQRVVPEELDAAVLDAFGLHRQVVAPLAAWAKREGDG